jgi:signal transduction histidine kinase/ActR/RegA family two-component response regulator
MLGRQAADLLNTNLAEIAAPHLLVTFKSPLLGGEGYHEGPGAFQTMPLDAWVSIRTTALYGPDKSVIGAIAIVEDLSERRRIEEDRLRVQKLESLGLLAGGLAHDFNNILTSVLGNISLVRSSLPIDSELADTLKDAERAALRARDLTQQLLTFAKGGAPVKKLHDIATLVREAASFTVRGSTCRCVYELDPNTWSAEVDAGQITQVVQNLVIHADQAMPDGGVITLRTANRIVVDGEFPDLPPGRYVEIKVSDIGVGIPEIIRNRIFDPYFTTKKRGSGLGLTMCASIVRKHGGYIGVESTPGRGSVFSVLLPASDVATRSLADTSMYQSSDLSGSERILVMDDEPAILELARRTLTRYGYTALLAEHGERAIQIFDEERAAGRRVDLAILNITVPGGMGGRETLRHLRARDPDLPALVSSGYSQDQVLAQFKDAGFSGIVLKPYRAEELLRAVRITLKVRSSSNKVIA